MKGIIYSAVILTGTGLVALLGGWDAGLKTLTVCMILDYILGMTAAGIFKSQRRQNADVWRAVPDGKGCSGKALNSPLSSLDSRSTF